MENEERVKKVQGKAWERRVSEKSPGSVTGAEGYRICQTGSAVDPSIHAQAGASSIAGTKSSEVALTVRTVGVANTSRRL